MPLNSNMASASLWDNLLSWLDESFGVLLKDESAESSLKGENKQLSDPVRIHNTQMKLKVNEWLLNLPDDFEPLDEEDDLCLTEEEMAIYEELMKKETEGKTEKNPLAKILKWLEDLTINRDKEEVEKEENELIGNLRRCESVEDFLNEKIKYSHIKEDYVPKQEELSFLNAEIMRNNVPTIVVPDCNEEQLFDDPYLDESSSTRIHSHCDSESIDDLDNDDNVFSKASKKSRIKIKIRNPPKNPMKKLGNYLSPSKTVYKQRRKSDVSDKSTEKGENFDLQKRRNERKPRSFSEGDVHTNKDRHPRMVRIKKRLEKRKGKGPKNNEGLTVDLSEDELEKKTTVTDEKTPNRVKRRLIKLVVNQAKYTLNGY